MPQVARKQPEATAVPPTSGAARPRPNATDQPRATVDDGSDREALAARALAGDAAAWGVLIGRHERRIVVSLVARGVSLARAGELAQEAWMVLLERQRAGRLPRLELPGLVLRQAEFLARDDARRSGRRDLPLDAIDLDRDAPDPSPSDEARLLSREELARAQAALSACSPPAQRAFRLVYDRPELTHAEAARELGLSEQRVRQIVFEVRRRLRAAVKEEP